MIINKFSILQYEIEIGEYRKYRRSKKFQIYSPCSKRIIKGLSTFFLQISVPDPYVFGPLGSGSGSFYQQENKLR